MKSPNTLESLKFLATSQQEHIFGANPDLIVEVGKPCLSLNVMTPMAGHSCLPWRQPDGATGGVDWVSAPNGMPSTMKILME